MLKRIPSETKVAVLMGGTSAERDVSFDTGRNCADALRQAGFVVEEYDTKDLDFIQALRESKPDVAFIALHGRGGEDGTVQGLLELLQIPYTGSGVLSSALAMDKLATKGVYRQAGLPTPPSRVAQRADGCLPARLMAQVSAELGDKVVVKPNKEGSSVGVTIVEDPAHLAAALQAAFRHDDCVLIERYIAGREIMAGVLDQLEGSARALPLIEVAACRGDFYDYDSKYVAGGSKHLLPAPLDNETRRRCQELALSAHEALACRGCSRSDIRLDSDGHPWLLETNTLPGMTGTSLVPEAARFAGIEFPQLLTLLVELAS